MNTDKRNAIISHCTIIGTVLSIILNQENKSESVSFYNRQTLGIFISFHLGSVILSQWDNWILNGFYFGICFFFFAISCFGVYSNDRKLIPFIGRFFQDNFKMF